MKSPENFQDLQDLIPAFLHLTTEGFHKEVQMTCSGINS